MKTQIFTIMFCLCIAHSAYAGSLLCEVIERTEKRIEMGHAKEAFTTEIITSSNVKLSLEATASTVRVVLPSGKTIEVAERLSQPQYQFVKLAVERSKDSYGENISYMKARLRKDVNTGLLNEAFYGDGVTPIRAARELVNFLERNTQSGGSKLKVEFITDGVPTTWEQIQAWSKIASTLNEVVERRMVDKVAEELAVRQEKIRDKQKQEENRRLFEQVLNDGKPLPPEVDLQAMLNKSIREPKAVLIKVSGFHHSVDYSRPLTIKIETWRNGIQVKVDGQYGNAKSLSTIVDGVRSYSNNLWRPSEPVSSAIIPGNN